MRARAEASQTLSHDLFCMRGIGILLVVLVHVLGVDASHGVRKLFPAGRTDLQVLVELIHSFNMAVMLMGSGVAVAAFGRGDSTLSDFLRKKLTKLLIPMLVWAPVLFLMQELSRGERPHGLAGWLELLFRVPGTWFPAYSIFWFVHALIGCTLLAWLYRRFGASRLGRWSGPVYLGLALILHFVASAWKARTGDSAAAYLEFILYWNRFFALGMLLFPWLGAVGEALSRRTVALQALVPGVFLSLIIAVYTVLPANAYAVVCVINGPLGFCMLFSLAVFLRNRGPAWGAVWQAAWSRLVFTGSISMTIYLFHLYFVAGTRIVLERVHPETLLMVHVGLGLLAGCAGPWLLYRAFKGFSWFQWSVGLPVRSPSQPSRQEPPRDGLAPIPWTPKL
jgi:fucose 4-O-acetylase-like acetyltransferase